MIVIPVLTDPFALTLVAEPDRGPAPLVVQFHDTSVHSTNSSWDSGDGSTAIVRDPVHTFLRPGTFTVRLSVTVPGDPIERVPDTVDSEERSVMVRIPLKPSFVYRLEPGYRVRFTDTSSGGPTWWHWEFGDGATSFEQHPVHVYPGPGTYPVSLLVSGGGPELRVERTVVVPPAPTSVSPPPLAAGFTAGPTAGVAPLQVRFTDTSTGGATEWHWEFGDGANSTEQHPVHVYREAGTYTIDLAVQDAAGSRARTTRLSLVRVEPPPDPGTETPSTNPTTPVPGTPDMDGNFGFFSLPDLAGPLVLSVLAAAVLAFLLVKGGRGDPGGEIHLTRDPSFPRRPPAQVSIETRSGLSRPSPGASAPEVTITIRTGMIHDTT